MSLAVCEALYPYKGTEGQTTPLLFEVGDEIQVLKKDPNGWWEGERDGHRGWFPAAYVKEKEFKVETEEVKTPSPLPTPPPPELRATVDPMAPGWKEVKAPDGRKYYYNRKTKETTWLRPTTKTVDENNSMVAYVNRQKSMKITLNEKTHTRALSSSSSLGASPPNSPIPSKQTAGDDPVFYVVNGICLPDTKRAKEQELLQPGKYSYCDYFWRDKGDKHVYESGFSVLLAKAHKGKHVCKEMADWFKAREALELQYSKGLASLAAEAFASSEEGTLGEAWKQVKTSILQESKYHKDLAAKLRSEVEKPLLDYKDEGKKELKRLEASMHDLRKQLTHKHIAVEREKIAMNDKQKDLETKLQSPKKTDDEISRAKRKSTKQREELGQTIVMYNDAKDKWFEDKVTSTLILENKEVARIEMVKRQLNKYADLIQSVSNKSIKSAESVKQKVTAADPVKDRELWVKQNKTGTVRPVDMPR